MKDHPNCELISEPEYVSVSFYYYPDSFLKRKQNGEGETEAFWEEMHNIPPVIKAKMVSEGTMMIAYQKQNQKNLKRKNFFRIILTADKGRDDALFALQEIHRLGKDLWKKIITNYYHMNISMFLLPTINSNRLLMLRRKEVELFLLVK